MARKVIGTNHNRKALDDTNENFKEIYEGDFLENGSLSGIVLEDNSLTEEKLKNNTIGLEKLKKDSVDDEKLKDNSITIFKVLNGQLSSTNILESVPLKKCGKNLFNKEKITRGYYFNGINLMFLKTTAADCVLINISEFSGKFLHQTHTNSIVIYDKMLNPIKGSATNRSIELPENAYFLGVTIFKGQEDIYQIEEGKSSTIYESYVDYIDSDELEDESIDKSKLTQKFVEPQPGKNLFDKNDVINGVYPDYMTGKIKTEPTFSCSNWIEVLPRETLIKTDPANQQYCWYYDKNEADFISGKSNGNLMTAPSNAKYLRIAARTKDLDVIQIEKGKVQTSYEPFAKYIIEEQLSPSVQAKLNPISVGDEIKLTIPNTLYLFRNEEFSIYWRNIIFNYHFFTNNNYVVRLQKINGLYYEQIGKDIGYKWFYTPESTNNFKIEIRIMNPFNDEIIDSKIVNVMISDKLQNVKIKKIVTVGDSFTDGYEISKFLHDFVSQDTNKTLNMIGLNDTGKTGVKDDAWSGYGYQWYHDIDRGYLRSDRSLSDAYWDSGWGENEINGWKTGQTYNDLTVEQRSHGKTKNQFFNPITKTFDFSYYMSTYQSNQKVDGFVSLLGLNDAIWGPVNRLKNNLPIYKTRIENIISSVKKYDSNIKIFLSLVTTQQENDSFMNSQGTEWLTSRRGKVCQEIWNNFILENFGNREDQGIFVMATNANFDYRYGILEGNYNPVKFDKNIVEKHARDVHPTQIGAKYIADTVRNWIDGILY